MTAERQEAFAEGVRLYGDKSWKKVAVGWGIQCSVGDITHGLVKSLLGWGVHSWVGKITHGLVCQFGRDDESVVVDLEAHWRRVSEQAHAQLAAQYYRKRLAEATAPPILRCNIRTLGDKDGDPGRGGLQGTRPYTP
eukprot:1193694-Prorocentrum_minimum.AAC.4